MQVSQNYIQNHQVTGTTYSRIILFSAYLKVWHMFLFDRQKIEPELKIAFWLVESLFFVLIC